MMDKVDVFPQSSPSAYSVTTPVITRVQKSNAKVDIQEGIDVFYTKSIKKNGDWVVKTRC